MVDYSRFDKIDEVLNDDEESSSSVVTTETAVPPLPAPEKMTKKGKSNRYRFEFEGRLIYEWEQSLEEVFNTCRAQVARADNQYRLIFFWSRRLVQRRPTLI
jgi:hypothetical protein